MATAARPPAQPLHAPPLRLPRPLPLPGVGTPCCRGWEQQQAEGSEKDASRTKTQTGNSERRKYQCRADSIVPAGTQGPFVAHSPSRHPSFMRTTRSAPVGVDHHGLAACLHHQRGVVKAGQVVGYHLCGQDAKGRQLCVMRAWQVMWMHEMQARSPLPKWHESRLGAKQRQQTGHYLPS